MWSFSQRALLKLQTSQPLHTWPWQGTSWEQPACREPGGRPWKPGVPLTTRLAVARQGTEAGGARSAACPPRCVRSPGVPPPAPRQGPRGSRGREVTPRVGAAPRERAPAQAARPHLASAPGRAPAPAHRAGLLHLRARLAGPAACSWGGGVGDTPRRRAQVKTGGTVYT